MESHLLQMRGLKHYVTPILSLEYGVASFTDAWIETGPRRLPYKTARSHLLQMRGLKQYSYLIQELPLSRIFYRCVD